MSTGHGTFDDHHTGSTGRPEDFAKRAEAIGYAMEGTDHFARLEPVAGRGRINFLPAVLAKATAAVSDV